MTCADDAVLLQVIDAQIVVLTTLRATIAARIETVAPATPAASGEASAVAAVPSVPAKPAKKAMTSKERSDKRRAELAKRGLTAKFRGSLKALRGCNDEIVAPCEIVAPVAPAVAPVPHIASSFFKENNDDEKEDARARGCNGFGENVAPTVAPSDSVVNFPVGADSVEGLTTDVHRIVREAARFPHEMDASTTAAYIERLLKIGVNPQTIRDATRKAAPKAGRSIMTFYYFARPGSAILTSHADALRALSIKAEQPQLPLSPTAQLAGRVRNWRERKDAGLEALASIDARVAAAAAHGNVYVKFGTPQWHAWAKHLSPKGFPRDRDGGWSFPTEWPPGCPERIEAAG